MPGFDEAGAGGVSRELPADMEEFFAVDGPQLRRRRELVDVLKSTDAAPHDHVAVLCEERSELHRLTAAATGTMFGHECRWMACSTTNVRP